MTVPDGETAKDRRRQWYVGIVSVVALLSILGNTLLSGLLVKKTNDDHAAAVAQQHQILVQQQKIVSLEKQHGADIVNESQLLQSLQNIDNGVIIPYVKNLDNALNAICVKVQAGCSVALPTPTTTTTTPPATTPAPQPRGATVPAAPSAPARPGHSGSAPGHNKSHK